MKVYFSLGSNIGDKNYYLHEALRKMSEIPGISNLETSEIIETEPWGFEAEENFLNCVAKADYYPNQAEILLNHLKQIEKDLGRNITAQSHIEGKRVYTSRTIDIDILFYGIETIDTDILKVPHPLMSQRDFVMIPLKSIAENEVKSAFPDIFQHRISK